MSVTQHRQITRPASEVGDRRSLLAAAASRAPMIVALSAVATVWVLGCVWSFTEQRAFAAAKGFADPALLPLVIDGLAASMGGVAYAASLDARPAVPARVGTALAVLASAASNGAWAAERSSGPGGVDAATVAIAVGIPVAANVAFEVLLAELRRQVQRRRGLAPPPPLPPLRLARLLLAPPSTFAGWRQQVLMMTATRWSDGEDNFATDENAGRSRDARSADEVSASTAEAAPDPGTGAIGAVGDPHRVGPPGKAELTASDAAVGCGVTAGDESDPGPKEPTEAPAGGSFGVDAEPTRRSYPRSPDPGTSASLLGAVGAEARDGAGERDGCTNGHVEQDGSDRRVGNDQERGEPPRAERNPQVWRVAQYMLAHATAPGVDAAPGAGSEGAWTGAQVAELVGGSRRHGQRLLARAIPLVAALGSTDPPSPPDGLADTPAITGPPDSSRAGAGRADGEVAEADGGAAGVPDREQNTTTGRGFTGRGFDPDEASGSDGSDEAAPAEGEPASDGDRLQVVGRNA